MRKNKKVQTMKSVSKKGAFSIQRKTSKKEDERKKRREREEKRKKRKKERKEEKIMDHEQ